MPDLIAAIQSALAAASTTPDREVRVIYLSVARSRHVQLVAEAQRLGSMLLEQEKELARTAGGQLSLEVKA